MTRGLWVGIRLTTGAAILAVLVALLGVDAFLAPLQRIGPSSLAAATAIAALTTACCAWRWRLVSRGLGSDLPLREAVLAYYRSQFLNTVLPGGVLGDVHRAVRRGRDVGDVGHGLRAVFWERAAGQVVQGVLTLGVLLALPSPLQSAVPEVTAAAAAVALLAVLLLSGSRDHAGPAARVGLWPRLAAVTGADVRNGLLARGRWFGVALASTLVVAGHTATFVLAARTVGSTVPLAQLLPLAMIVLLAMSLPTNVAGWGPREGVAAWVFALAGLGAAEGVAVAVAYGVLALVATLPGGLVLVLSSRRRRATSPVPAPVPAPVPTPAHAPGGSVPAVGGAGGG
jgi:uncharacterized membrane protein YbhN (UPF0104 family)